MVIDAYTHRMSDHQASPLRHALDFDGADYALHRLEVSRLPPGDGLRLRPVSHRGVGLEQVLLHFHVHPVDALGQALQVLDLLGAADGHPARVDQKVREDSDALGIQNGVALRGAGRLAASTTAFALTLSPDYSTCLNTPWKRTIPTKMQTTSLPSPALAEELGKRIIRLATYYPRALGLIEKTTDGVPLNADTYAVTVAGASVSLMEFQLLRFFVQNPGRVFRREEILFNAGGTDYLGGARTVDVHARRLLSKLRTDGARGLRTGRNVGYGWERAASDG